MAYEAIPDEQPAIRLALDNLVNAALVDGKFDSARVWLTRVTDAQDPRRV